MAGMNEWMQTNQLVSKYNDIQNPRPYSIWSRDYQQANQLFLKHVAFPPPLPSDGGATQTIW